MKIAVTYQDGAVFQHFGHTENFKIYTVEDNAVVEAVVLNTCGQGHGALAGLLSNQEIKVLICGGIGGGAKTALANAGIELVAGASGDADAAVAAYLSGALVNDTTIECNHHGHEHGEGHTCENHHSCSH